MEAVRWEYRVVTFRTPELPRLQSDLNEWGRSGWELVSLTSTVKFWNRALNANEMVGILKRPGIDEADRDAPEPGADTSGWM